MPGVRMNLSKSGTSLSLGGRGARVTIGNSRITKTVGLPGTGLSYSETTRTNRVGGEITPKRARQLILSALAEQAIENELNAYNSFLSIANSSENLKNQTQFDAELLTKEFTLERYGLQKFGRWTVTKSYLKYLKKINLILLVTLLGSIFLFSKSEIAGTVGIVFSVYSFALQLPVLLGYGFYKSKRIVAENEMLIKKAQELHPAAEAQRIEQLNAIYNGDQEVLETELESAIEGFSDYIAQLPHKFDLNVSFELRDKENVVLDTDLPEIENVVIAETKKALKSGEVSIKDKKEKEINQEYAVGVIGIAFNLASRIFNTSPCIKNVILTGYTQRLDDRIGKVRDHYIYKINFDRNLMSTLNLNGIDPLKSVQQFTHWISLDKSLHFDELDLKETA